MQEDSGRDERKKELGRAGEGLAVRYLRQKGWKVVEQNYRCRLGEIDLIAERQEGRQGLRVVFVEVKTRRRGDQVSPLELIPPSKQRKISRTAQHYLAHRHGPEVSADFGVLLIEWPATGSTPKIEWIEGAFFSSCGY